MSVKVYVAKVDKIIEINGETVELKRGRTRVIEGHEILEEHADLFRVAGVKYGLEDTRRPY